MTDPDLTERIAAQFINTPCDTETCQLEGSHRWALMHPDDRAYWRGVIALITDLLDTDRARPWPRVGTIDGETLQELDARESQARESEEQ